MEPEHSTFPRVDEEDSVDGGKIGDNLTPTSGRNKRSHDRKLKSKWWQYFDMLPRVEGEPLKCKCKACGQQYGAESHMGTGNLSHHVSRCPRLHTQDISQTLLEQGEKGLVTRLPQFNQERFRELLVLALINHDMPFQFVEYEAIRATFTYLQPQIQHISRNTAKADVLKIYKRERIRLSQQLRACPGKFSFTSDLWTSIATDGYLCLTAHYIDSNWLLWKKIISFSYMPPPHSGVALSEKIYNLLNGWGIENKVFAMTLDNAAANDVFVDLLRSQFSVKVALVSEGEFLHVRCCAHILNLIGQEGLKNIDKSVDAIRECVKYVKGSQVRKQKFLECVAQTSLDPGKALRQDVPTRWNSTFMMLSTALYYRRAFNYLQLSDSNFTYCPSNEEWGKVEKLCKFLEMFHDTTKLFSGTKYPTANLYFPNVFSIQLSINQGLGSSDPFMSQMAMQMSVKFDKYWKEFNVLLAIAVVFDPRYKFQFVEFCYKKLYGAGSKELRTVKTKLFSMFDEYTRAFAKPSQSGSSSTSCVTSNDFAQNRDCNDVLKEFKSFQSTEFATSAQKSQLDLYLDEALIEVNAKLDVLSFWKAHQYRYPELAQMARDILSVPISTVASESAFSTGGRVLDQYRSALKSNVVEALICCRDWLFEQKDSVTVKLDELTENILSMNVNVNVNEDIEDDGKSNTSLPSGQKSLKNQTRNLLKSKAGKGGDQVIDDFL